MNCSCSESLLGTVVKLLIRAQLSSKVQKSQTVKPDKYLNVAVSFPHTEQLVHKNTIGGGMLEELNPLTQMVSPALHSH